MIVVNIDLWPWGERARIPEDRLAKILIWNDGTSGESATGNYEARIIVGDGPDHPDFLEPQDVLATCRIEGYIRSGEQSHIANLLRNVLDAIGPVDLPSFRAKTLNSQPAGTDTQTSGDAGHRNTTT